MQVDWQEEPCEHDEDLILGISVPTIYEDVTFYLCQECGAGWHKFTDENMRRLVEKVVGSEELQLRFKDAG